MNIDDRLRNILHRAIDEAPPPDLERFRSLMLEYSAQSRLDFGYSTAHIGLGRAWAITRVCALAAIAISAVMFVIVYHLNSRTLSDAQRELARAQLIGPLLPALTGENPDRRATALAVAQQVDPTFASGAAAQLARLEASQTQTQLVTERIKPYSDRIYSGLQKLQLSRDPDDRATAIWQNLLPVLKDARQNRDDFIEVALEYKKVLPLLRIREPEVFRESYWGELWIFNILLDSKVGPVVEAAQQLAPPPTVVEQIFEQHAAALPYEKRKAFEEAVATYEKALKTIQPASRKE